jgi:hypothetical protein
MQYKRSWQSTLPPAVHKAVHRPDARQTILLSRHFENAIKHEDTEARGNKKLTQSNPENMN